MKEEQSKSSTLKPWRQPPPCNGCYCNVAGEKGTARLLVFPTNPTLNTMT
ncbi:hypothetical protein SESBI_49717 [Sesbania bispinosa]|nr:hypothetical protein SESBI_49717 [Sesbania bispinosa]